jgi:hypothetical protein
MCTDQHQVDEALVPSNILHRGLSWHRRNWAVDVAACSRADVETSRILYHYHNFHIFSVVR